MAKWEYITLTRNIIYLSEVKYEWSDKNKIGFDERLNDLGEQGWELVSAFPESSNSIMSEGTTTRIKLIFKRSK